MGGIVLRSSSSVGKFGKERLKHSFFQPYRRSLYLVTGNLCCGSVPLIPCSHILPREDERWRNRPSLRGGPAGLQCICPPFPAGLALQLLCWPTAPQLCYVCACETPGRGVCLGCAREWGISLWDCFCHSVGMRCEQVKMRHCCRAGLGEVKIELAFKTGKRGGCFSLAV